MENKILKINDDLNNQKNNINNLQKDFKEDLNYYNKQNEENNLKLEKKIKDLKKEFENETKKNLYVEKINEINEKININENKFIKKNEYENKINQINSKLENLENKNLENQINLLEENYQKLLKEQKNDNKEILLLKNSIPLIKKNEKENEKKLEELNEKIDKVNENLKENIKEINQKKYFPIKDNNDLNLIKNDIFKLENKINEISKKNTFNHIDKEMNEKVENAENKIRYYDSQIEKINENIKQLEKENYNYK